MAEKTPTKASRPKKASTGKKATAAKGPKKAAQKEEQRDTCFVMMPFSNPINIYYEDLYKPAIKAAGLEPTRADDLFRHPMKTALKVVNTIAQGKIRFARKDRFVDLNPSTSRLG